MGKDFGGMWRPVEGSVRRGKLLNFWQREGEGIALALTLSLVLSLDGKRWSRKGEGLAL